MRLLIEARNRAVGVENGRIVEAAGSFDLVLRFPHADVRPGLINAHDHLHRNHYGRLGTPPYRDACHWAHDIQENCRERIDRGQAVLGRDALLFGAWKNLFAGVTTLVHHDPWEADFECDFPLRVLRINNADSIGMTPDLPGIEPGRLFSIHLSEGVGPAAADEVRRIEEKGLLTPELVAVHGVGMDESGIEAFRASGAALVWCPTSNLFLFGRTAAPMLLRDGLDVLLGSDSLLTAQGDLLDELRFARCLGLLSDRRLEEAVGVVAARRLGIPAPSLNAGTPADLVLLSKPLLDASAEDVELVIAGGTPRLAKPELQPLLQRIFPKGCRMAIGSLERWINGEASSLLRNSEGADKRGS